MADNLKIITEEEYDELCHDRDTLQCLQAAGVDNWEGYDYAMELLREQTGEEV